MRKKSYLVSGAGSGIGRSIAIALASASEDNHVILLGRNRKSLQETQSLLSRADQHSIVIADIRERNELTAEFKRIKLLSSELAADGVLVNAVCPGWVETEMATQGLKQMAQNLAIPYEEARAQQLSHVLLRKMSAPGEIAALVRFLVSGEQVSMTGQTLDINNGAFMN